MEGVYFRQEKIEKESPKTYLYSKFLGVPVFPAGFLRNKKGESILADEDYFIMQINLEDIADRQTLLPKKGMLYFFINVETLQPKVLYAKDDEECDLEVYDDINEGFDKDSFGETVGYRLVFDKALEEGHFILGDINPDIDLETDVDTNGYVTLLEIDCLNLPNDNILKFGDLAVGEGHYIFLIKETDLKKLNFSKVVFVEKED